MGPVEVEGAQVWGLGRGVGRVGDDVLAVCWWILVEGFDSVLQDLQDRRQRPFGALSLLAAPKRAADPLPRPPHHSQLSPGAPESHPRYTRWINILRQYLLPSLSLLEHHAPAAMELWSILRLLPAERRYQLYGEWKDALYRRVPALGVRKAEAERDIKSVLRRLSTDNAKVLGKTLAKIAHTNPTIVFAVTLHQVQSYDNLIVPVVDAVRYLTDFGYDVLSYSVLDALSASKSKTKEDGTSVALWLQGESQRAFSPLPLGADSRRAQVSPPLPDNSTAVGPPCPPPSGSSFNTSSTNSPRATRRT